MHDFHLADSIYKVIMEYADKNELKKITKAVIELGSIVEHGEEVLPANLEFNIKMLAEGGIADGLSVEIIAGEGNNWTLKEIEGE
ncbi:MAG: hypothetical protein WCT26_01995 [Candidatus Buchananbacteria bacterium]|jgi:Zn finger protein HypA/HybF involved in hydrogenase expression